MSRRAEALARLVARARAELPEPGDPRKLMEELVEQDAVCPEALGVLQRTSLAWQQLREMSLERSWQNGFGWFLARNLMLLGLIALVITLAAGVPLPLLESALLGAGAYYVIVLTLAPLRVARHRRRRQGILTAYGEDLAAYLDGLTA